MKRYYKSVCYDDETNKRCPSVLVKPNDINAYSLRRKYEDWCNYCECDGDGYRESIINALIFDGMIDIDCSLVMEKWETGEPYKNHDKGNIQLTFGTEEKTYSVYTNINFCPMCGRKLKTGKETE